MTHEIEAIFAHLLNPRCRLRAADRRVELARLRDMVREAMNTPAPSVPYAEWPASEDRGMRVPGAIGGN